MRITRAATLIEVMVSFFVISTIGLGTSAALITASKGARQSEIRTIAANLAQQQIEVLRSRGFSNLQPISDTAFPIPSSAVQFLNSVHSVTGTYNIESISGRPNLRRINVRVRWKNGSVSTQSEAPWSEVTVSALRAQGSEPGEVQ